MTGISDENSPFLIETASLSASYGKHAVLHDVSASFSKGEFVFLLGPNGSGKSTFLSILAGTEVPSLSITEGKCLLSGREVSSYSPLEKARIRTFLPQNEMYSWNYTVLEAVRMGRYAQSKGVFSYSQEDNDASREALSKAGIAHLEDRFVFELSGGELQSVLIARSLAQNTPVMLLDEPFTSLDADKSDRLTKLLKGIVESENKCVIMSIHDINCAPVFADRILLFSEGKMIADGKPMDVFTAENLEKAYGTPFIQYTHPVFGVPQVCIKN